MSLRWSFPALALLAVACGGRTPLEGGDLLGPGGNDSGVLTGDDGGVIPGEDGGIIVTDGGVIGPDASLVDGVIGFDASTGDATVIDTGIDTGVDTGTGIACGAESCDPASQQCCLTFGGMGGQMCVATGTCPGIALDCTGPETCMNGDACCLTFQGGGPTAMCRPGCNGGPRLCETDQDCPARRPRCVAGPFGVKICQR